MKVQDSVKKETTYVAITTGVGTAILLVIYAVLGKVFPDLFHFGISAVISGILGAIIAIANFFIMGLTVQKIVATEDLDQARRMMGVSYRYRTLMQLGWIVLCMVVPVLNLIAGAAPLFFPSICIKLRGIKEGLTFHPMMAAAGNSGAEAVPETEAEMEKTSESEAETEPEEHTDKQDS